MPSFEDLKNPPPLRESKVVTCGEHLPKSFEKKNGVFLACVHRIPEGGAKVNTGFLRKFENMTKSKWNACHVTNSATVKSLFRDLEHRFKPPP